jgi:hypothetical protein
LETLNGTVLCCIPNCPNFHGELPPETLITT